MWRPDTGEDTSPQRDRAPSVDTRRRRQSGPAHCSANSAPPPSGPPPPRPRGSSVCGGGGGDFRPPEGLPPAARRERTRRSGSPQCSGRRRAAMRERDVVRWRTAAPERQPSGTVCLEPVSWRRRRAAAEKAELRNSITSALAAAALRYHGNRLSSTAQGSARRRLTAAGAVAGPRRACTSGRPGRRGAAREAPRGAVIACIYIHTPRPADAIHSVFRQGRRADERLEFLPVPGRFWRPWCAVVSCRDEERYWRCDL